MREIKFLVIGETCIDVHQYGNCPRLSPEGPAPVFIPTYTLENLGMASNVLNNLKSLIKGIGLDNCRIDIISNPHTRLRKTRYIDEKTNQLLLRIDANDKCNLYNGVIDYQKYDCVIISDYDKGFLDKEAIREICQKSKISVLDTKKPIGEWCEDATFIKINEPEYVRSELTKILFDKTIVTLGERGAKFKSTIYPVQLVEIKDVSGAGDTFLAAFCLKYIISGYTVDDAIKFANLCSTQVVQMRGVAIVDPLTL